MNITTMQQQNLTTPSLARSSISDLPAEKIIGAPRSLPLADLPPFPAYESLRNLNPQNTPDRNNVLLIIPTANSQKTRILLKAFSPPPTGGKLHHLVVPADSGVGEQPYDDAGLQGAHNRIANALLQTLTSSPLKLDALLAEKKIGTVMAASIENYIQRQRQRPDGGVDVGARPADYGVVMVHNATTGETAAVVSAGVTVPREYLEYARSFGFEEGDEMHGRVTVGYVLAANVPGLDLANWHAVVVGRSRYDLLEEAIEEGLRIPW